MVERCDEEFIKVLKGCDAHSHEYVDRLKDEPKVTELLEMAQILVDKLGSPSEMCRIYLKRIEHIYFKFDARVIQQKNVSQTYFLQTQIALLVVALWRIFFRPNIILANCPACS